MRIKKVENKNEYISTPQGMWVRNFTKKLVPYQDINNYLDNRDHFQLLKNEFNNNRAKITWIDKEELYHESAVIVSDGYGFEAKQEILNTLPQNVALIGVHGALRKWKPNNKRSLTYYVANNPYNECMKYLPRRQTMPKCIVSNRTNSEFLENYRGVKYRYAPVPTADYDGHSNKDSSYKIDDYRNAICAAVSLCYRFDVRKLLLFCCDDVFKDKRPSAVQLENGLWMYPQQNISHGLIDGSIYWLQHGDMQDSIVADHSNGPKYEHTGYIEENEIRSFLEVSYD